MKLLVDEMPRFKEDCLFAEQKWSDNDALWINYCQFTDTKCDLDAVKEECSCLSINMCKVRNEQIHRCRYER